MVEVRYSTEGTTQNDRFEGKVQEIQVFSGPSPNGCVMTVCLINGRDQFGPVRFVGYSQAYRVIRRPAVSGSGEAA